ncbi:MAG: HEAT repeat domain-containing protein, partial [Planctomycetota bacterium]
MRLAAGLLFLAILAAHTAAQEDEIAKLKSLHAAERRNAALALAQMGPEAVAAVPALLETLDDTNAMVRHAAMLALGGIRDPRGVAPLAKLLASPDERTRRIASVSLAEIGAPALPAVRNVLRKSARSTARLAATHTLAELGHKAAAAVPDLEAALEDQAAAVRVGSARALLAVKGQHA